MLSASWSWRGSSNSSATLQKPWGTQAALPVDLAALTAGHTQLRSCLPQGRATTAGTARTCRLLAGRPGLDQLHRRRQELEVGAPKSEQQVEHHS
jgi:hypothetical protein